MESADHIFTECMIDAGFSTHRGVHLSQQGRGYLNKIDTSLVAGGGKAAHISNNTAAKSNQGSVTSVAVFQQAGKNLVQDLQILENFSIRENAFCMFECFQVGFDVVQI